MKTLKTVKMAVKTSQLKMFIIAFRTKEYIFKGILKKS